MRNFPQILDDHVKALIHELALECCQDGDSPSTRFGLRTTHKRFNSLAAQLKIIDYPLISFDLSTDEHHTALILVDNEVGRLHLKMMSSPEAYLAQIQQRAPDLAEQMTSTGDDAGLVDISSWPRKRLWAECGNLAVYLTPCIPGSLNASWPLSGTIFQSPNSLKLKIRPDPYRICNIDSASETFELSLTHGKKFNQNWLNQLKGTEIAQHDPDGTWQCKGHTTQYIWERLDGSEVQFACEELPHFYDRDSIPSVACTRFLHGIYDQRSGVLTHYDGAVHMYSSPSYQRRLDLNLKSHFKDYAKAKIFRIDGSIPLDSARYILSDFFRWNSVASEYFTP